MFGFSVFLGTNMSDETSQYIKTMSQNGFTGIFTSMHIPEDDSSKYKERITALGTLAKENNLSLMVDISTKGLSTLGFDLEKDISSIKLLGITGLRMDYGISMSVIAKASHEITIGLNASTLSDKDVRELKDNHAKFENMEFWHNYYPREETGLEKNDFIKKNEWLKVLGGKVVAFVPGDNVLRGPLFNGLPTLEEHRNSHPLAASLDLIHNCFVDEVYVGDEQIKSETINQFKTYADEKIIQLHTHILSEDYSNLLEGVHTNRMDAARDVVRSQEARFKEIPHIKQINTTKRKQGSITLDNHLYGRYQGELQIAKHDLVADPRVNVMGQIREQDMELIKWIVAGQSYEFIREEK